MSGPPALSVRKGEAHPPLAILAGFSRPSRKARPVIHPILLFGASFANQTPNWPTTLPAWVVALGEHLHGGDVD